MTADCLDLLILEDRLAVCRLDHRQGLPDWLGQAGFLSITRTADELSVVCLEASIPEGIRAEKGWRALRVAGSIEFEVVGVLAALAVPLAGAGISLFALSTFDTDYVLVKEHDLERVAWVLTAKGHTSLAPTQGPRVHPPEDQMFESLFPAIVA